MPKHRDSTFCSECVSRICEHAMSAPKHLRPRECSFLRFLANGLSNREIAELTGLTEGSVKTIMAHTFRAVGARDRLAAGLWARDHMDLIGSFPLVKARAPRRRASLIVSRLKASQPRTFTARERADNERWNKTYKEKFEDPEYYAEPTVRSASPLSGL
jgi:DNA-binding CsgD family transcriptional regulator